MQNEELKQITKNQSASRPTHFWPSQEFCSPQMWYGHCQDQTFIPLLSSPLPTLT